MNNFEYVNRKRSGTTGVRFSDKAREIFLQHEKIVPFDGGGADFDGRCMDWLNHSADIALDFQVGNLIQWDETQSECGDPQARRKGVYGIVVELKSYSDSIDHITMKTTNHYGNPVDMCVDVSAYKVRMANIPDDILTIVRSSLEEDAKIKASGNNIEK